MTLPVVPWPGGVKPRHVRQLQTGSPTRGTDCGPSSLTMALEVASGPGLRPGLDLHADWIAALRLEMTHGPAWPATTLPNHMDAAMSDLTMGAFLAVGRRRPIAQYRVLPFDDIADALRRGCAVVVGIDYGRLNDLMPRLSGSPAFRGQHFVCLQGHERTRGSAWTHLGDPLHDGRRPGIPRGWQTVRLARYLRAAETFGTPKAGAGKAKVCLILPAKER